MLFQIEEPDGSPLDEQEGPGIAVGMHIFTGSKAPWDHIGGDAPQFPEFPPA